MSAPATTPNLGLPLPVIGSPGWGTLLNANLLAIDAAVGAIQQPYQGAWSSVVTYLKGQIVSAGGIVYIGLVDANLDNPPASSPSEWQALGSGLTVAPVALGPGAPGEFIVAHGLGQAPSAVTIEMTSGGQIWFYGARYDATNLYLVASDGGITGKAQCFL